VHARELSEAHARRLFNAPPIANLSDVDEVVFGEDKDNSAQLVPNRHHSAPTHPVGLGHVEGRNCTESSVGEMALQWNDVEFATFRPELAGSPAKKIPAHRQDTSDIMSMQPSPQRINSQRSGTTSSSHMSAALDYRGVPVVGPFRANPTCPNCGSDCALEAKRCADQTRKMHCGKCGYHWDELPMPPAGPSGSFGLDFRGRGVSTSNVDEAVFGKTSLGNRIPVGGCTANFGVGKRGEIGMR